MLQYKTAEHVFEFVVKTARVKSYIILSEGIHACSVQAGELVFHQTSKPQRSLSISVNPPRNL